MILYSKKVLRRYWAKVAVTGENDCWPWLAARVNGYGVLAVKNRPVYAHRLGMEFKLGRKLVGNEKSLHKCDNRACQNPKHLFLGTQLDNMRDMIAKDRHARGERNGNSKLTEVEVRAIRDLYEAGWRQCELAEAFGVTYVMIKFIVTYHSWRHVA